MAFNTLKVGKGAVLKDQANNQYSKTGFIRLTGDFVSIIPDLTNDTQDIVIESGLTSKGQILVHDDNGLAALPVGVDSFMLISDSNATEGIAWVPAEIGFAVVNSLFNIPAFQAEVSILVSTTRWMNIGQHIYIEDAGEYLITAIASLTQITVRNISPLNPTTGQVNIAKKITASGARGTDGINGFTSTTSGFTVPAVNTNVTIDVESNAFVNLTQVIFIATAGFYAVASLPNSTSIEITNLGWQGNAVPTTVIATAQLVTSSGPKGADGISSFTLTTANFTVPATGSNVLVNVGFAQGFALEQGVFIEGAGAYEVVSIPNDVLLELKNLGATGNAIETTIINTGAKIVPGGIEGATGKDPISLTTANFTQPTANNDVLVNLDDTYWLSINGYIYNTLGGFYRVITIDSATTATIRNIGDNENATAGTTIPLGSKFIPSGRPGTDGINGTNGTDGIDGINAYTTTTSSETVPALNNQINIDVVETGWMSLNQYLYFTDGSTLRLDAIAGNTLTLTNTFAGNVVGNTINIGDLVITGAIPGTAGINGYGVTTASFIMPNPGDTVTIATDSTDWMSVDLSIFIEAAGYFTVDSITNQTSFVARLFDDPLNAAPTTLIASQSTISPAGLRGADSSDIAIALELNHQVSDPAAKAGKILLYAKTDGLYQRDAGGTITKIGEFGGTLAFGSAITFDSATATYIFQGDGTNQGKITLNCEQNSHGIVLSSPPHSAAANYTWEFPDDMGNSGEILSTNGSGKTSWIPYNGGSLSSIGDGTNTVNNATAILFTGATVAPSGNTALVTIPSSQLVTLGDLLYFDGTNIAKLAKGTQNQVLAADDVLGLKWVTNTGGGSFNSPTTTKGDLIVRNDTEDVRLPVGLDSNSFLSPEPTSSEGLAWKKPTLAGAQLYDNQVETVPLLTNSLNPGESATVLLNITPNYRLLNISEQNQQYFDLIICSNSEPTNAPDPNVVLLINGDEEQSGDYDRTGKHKLTYNNGVSISNVQQFASRDVFLFNGTNGYISLSDSDDWQFTGDFLIKFKIYPLSVAANEGIICSTDSNDAWMLEFTSSGQLRFLSRQYQNDSIDYVDFTTVGTLALNSWQEVALIRIGSTLSIYIQGNPDGNTGNYAGVIEKSSSNGLNIGRRRTSTVGSKYYHGYMADIYINNGDAEITGSYTPDIDRFTHLNLVVPGNPIAHYRNINQLQPNLDGYIDAIPLSYTVPVVVTNRESTSVSFNIDLAVIKASNQSLALERNLDNAPRYYDIDSVQSIPDGDHIYLNLDIERVTFLAALRSNVDCRLALFYYLSNQSVPIVFTDYNPSYWGNLQDPGNYIIDVGISQLNDLSGNSFHLTAPTQSRQPLLNSNALNGRSTILFDGIDDYLVSGANITINGEATVIFLAKFNQATQPTSDFDYVFSIGNAVANQGFSFNRNDDTNEFYWWDGTGSRFSTYILEGNQWYLVRMVLSNQQPYLRVIINGREITPQVPQPTTPITFTNKELYVGRYLGSDDHFLNGEIGEFIFIPQALTELDSEKIEGTIAHYFGITELLADNHGFKEVSPEFDFSQIDSFTLTANQDYAVDQWLANYDDAESRIQVKITNLSGGATAVNITAKILQSISPLFNYRYDHRPQAFSLLSDPIADNDNDLFRLPLARTGTITQLTSDVTGGLILYSIYNPGDTSEIDNDITALYLLNNNLDNEVSGSYALTLSGSAVLSATQSKFGGFSLFNNRSGSNSSGATLVNSAASFDPNNDFVISAWIYPLSYGDSNQKAIFSTFTAALTGYRILEQSGTLYLESAVSNSYSQDTTTIASVLPLNQFSHVAMIRSGNTISLRIEDQEILSTTDNRVLPVAGDWIIGNQEYLGTTSAFDAYFDDIQLKEGSSDYQYPFEEATIYNSIRSFSQLSLIANKTQYLHLPYVNESANDNYIWARFTNQSGSTTAVNLTGKYVPNHYPVGIYWRSVIKDFTASKEAGYFVNTTNPVTGFLPPDPDVGDNVYVISLQSTTITIDRQGHKIDNLEANVQITDTKVIHHFLYTGPAYGWVWAQANGSGGGSLTVGDGVTSINGVTSLLITSGGTITANGTEAQLAIAGGTGHNILANNTPLPLQPDLNIEGDLVSGSNDIANNASKITINSGLTSLGDILFHNGSNLSRLAKGTQGQVLTADDVNGLIWSTVSGGGGGILNHSFHDDDFNASLNNIHLIDTGTKVITSQLPINPADGSWLIFSDHGSNFHVHQLIINVGTGDNLLDIPSGQLILHSRRAAIQLVFYQGKWTAYGTESFIDQASTDSLIPVTILHRIYAQTIVLSTL